MKPYNFFDRAHTASNQIVLGEEGIFEHLYCDSLDTTKSGILKHEIVEAIDIFNSVTGGQVGAHLTRVCCRYPQQFLGYKLVFINVGYWRLINRTIKALSQTYLL